MSARSRARFASSDVLHHGGAACASFGHVPNVRGDAPALWEAGWLPRRAAAQAMGISLRELDRAVEAGAIRRRRVGPRAVLYQVVSP